MSRDLHVAAHIDNFKAFPTARFAISVASDPGKLAPPDARDRARAIAVADELPPERLAQLRNTAATAGRVILLFATWAPFNAALRALRG